MKGRPPLRIVIMSTLRHNSRVEYRGVAQLVARTAGGREAAGSSPVTPTKNYSRKGPRIAVFFSSLEDA